MTVVQNFDHPQMLQNAESCQILLSLKPMTTVSQSQQLFFCLASLMPALCLQDTSLPLYANTCNFVHNTHELQGLRQLVTLDSRLH